jgi:hypothetical protein
MASAEEASASAAEDACARLMDACDHGDYAAVVAILHAHSADARMQAAGCRVLAGMTDTTAESEVEAAAAGAIEAVVAALKKHVAVARVAIEGCRALANVAHSETTGNSVQAAAAGAIEAVVAVLRLHPGDARVQALGCVSLAVLIRDETGRIRAGTAGAVEAVLAALLAHAADADVACDACITMHNLLVNDKDNNAKALSLGVHHALIDVVQMHATNALVQEQSVRVSRVWKVPLKLAVNG